MNKITWIIELSAKQQGGFFWVCEGKLKVKTMSIWIRMPCRQTLGEIKRQKPTRRRMCFTEVYYISAGQTSLPQVQCKFYIGRVLCSILPEIGGTIFTPDYLQDAQGFLVPRLLMTFSVCRPNRGKGRLIRTSLRFQNSSEKRYSD